MDNWKPIKEIDKNQNLKEFLFADGTIKKGRWQPFWCGSDCPCDVTGEQDDLFCAEPSCWCFYADGTKYGEDIDPISFREIAN